jgi:hypothetical protein
LNRSRKVRQRPSEPVDVARILRRHHAHSSRPAALIRTHHSANRYECDGPGGLIHVAADCHLRRRILTDESLV